MPTRYLSPYAWCVARSGCDYRPRRCGSDDRAQENELGIAPNLLGRGIHPATTTTALANAIKTIAAPAARRLRPVILQAGLRDVHCLGSCAVSNAIKPSHSSMRNSNTAAVSRSPASSACFRCCSRRSRVSSSSCSVVCGSPERLRRYRARRTRRAASRSEASVEHLIASASGGTNDDSNCVVCCKSLNAAFGSRGVKEKFRAVLNHRGPLVCPSKATSRLEPVESSIEDPQISLVIADLHRRGSTKPRKEKSLRNTIAAAFHQTLAEEELSSLLERLQAQAIVSISDGKVTYNLPAKAG